MDMLLPTQVLHRLELQYSSGRQRTHLFLDLIPELSHCHTQRTEVDIAENRGGRASVLLFFYSGSFAAQSGIGLGKKDEKDDKNEKAYQVALRALGLPIGRVFSNFGGGFGGLLWNANSSRQRFRSFCI